MKVGDTVTFRVRNALYNNRAIYSSGVYIPEYNTYTGKIITNPNWVEPDYICLTTGNNKFPYRIISKTDIITEGFQVNPNVSNSSWEIEGSNSKKYLVTREGTHWACNCVGFGFRRSCSHVVKAKSLNYNGDFVPFVNSLINKEEKNLEKKQKKSVGRVDNPPNRRYDLKVRLKRGNPAPLKYEVTMSKVAKVAKVSKRSQAIAIMNANANSDMSTVVDLIAKAIEVTEANARSYYRFIVENKLATGTVVKAGRTRKTKEVSAKKLLKEVGLSDKLQKSADEIASIKAKNLALMKEVAAKKNTRKTYSVVAAKEGPGVPDFDPKVAKAQVAKYVETGDFDDLTRDPFAAPAKLSKDELNALV